MDSFPLAVAIALLSILCVLCLFGLFQAQINEVLGTFFALLLRPFLQINDSLQSFWGRVAAFYRDQFLVNGQLDLQRIFFQFIGAVLYTIFFFGFNFSEFHLLALSMTAAGIDSANLCTAHIFCFPVKRVGIFGFFYHRKLKSEDRAGIKIRSFCDASDIKYVTGFKLLNNTDGGIFDLSPQFVRPGFINS